MIKNLIFIVAMLFSFKATAQAAVQVKLDELSDVIQVQLDPSVLATYQNELGTLGQMLKTKLVGNELSLCGLRGVIKGETSKMGLNQAATTAVENLVDGLEHAGFLLVEFDQQDIRSSSAFTVFQQGTVNFVYPEYRGTDLIDSMLNYILDPSSDNLELYQLLHETFRRNIEVVRATVDLGPTAANLPQRKFQWFNPVSKVKSALQEMCK